MDVYRCVGTYFTFLLNEADLIVVKDVNALCDGFDAPAFKPATIDTECLLCAVRQSAVQESALRATSPTLEIPTVVVITECLAGELTEQALLVNIHCVILGLGLLVVLAFGERNHPRLKVAQDEHNLNDTINLEREEFLGFVFPEWMIRPTIGQLRPLLELDIRQIGFRNGFQTT